MADLSITAASVLKGTSGSPTTGTLAAGVTVTQGQALYQLTDGTWGLADANGTSPANTFGGFALTAGGPGQPVVIDTSDTAYICGATVLSGDTIWLSATPGGITKTIADLIAGMTVIVIGVVNTNLSLKLSPVTGGVK